MILKKEKSKTDGIFTKFIEASLFLAIIHVSYVFSFSSEWFAPYDARNISAYSDNAIFILLGAFFILMFNNTFNAAKKSWVENTISIFISTSLILVFTSAIAFIFRGFAFPRTVLLQSYVIQFVVLSLAKNAIVASINHLRGKKDVMIISYVENFEEISTKVMLSTENRDRIKYYFSPESDFMSYFDEVDKIFLGSNISPRIKDEVITKCLSNNKSLYIIPSTFEIATFDSDFVNISDYLAFKIDSLELSLEKRILKRLLDIVVSLLGIIVASPIMVIAAIAIVVTDGFPIFFRQERATKGNRIFKIIKFRSMIKNAEGETGAILASKNDSRITPVGKVMRRFWIDELPQLFNVLKGDMSMVGPRPERPVFIKEFTEYLPHFEYRMSVKAGVTGLAQVLGKYSTSPDKKIRFDLMYIRRASLLYDIKIIVETVKKIMLGTLKRGNNEEPTFDSLLEKHDIKLKSISNGYMFIYNQTE